MVTGSNVKLADYSIGYPLKVTAFTAPACTIKNAYLCLTIRMQALDILMNPNETSYP